MAINKNYEEEAEIFCSAIEEFANHPENLENMKLYLSRHFEKWLELYANSPLDIACDLLRFARLED